jgi:hypothetical protein
VTRDTCHVMTYGRYQGLVPETYTKTDLSADSISKSGNLEESSFFGVTCTRQKFKRERARPFWQLSCRLRMPPRRNMSHPRGDLGNRACRHNREDRRAGPTPTRASPNEDECHTNVIARHIHGRPHVVQSIRSTWQGTAVDTGRHVVPTREHEAPPSLPRHGRRHSLLQPRHSFPIQRQRGARHLKDGVPLPPASLPEHALARPHLAPQQLSESAQTWYFDASLAQISPIISVRFLAFMAAAISDEPIRS